MPGGMHRPYGLNVVAASTGSPGAGGVWVSMYEPTAYADAAPDGLRFSNRISVTSQPSAVTVMAERVYR